MSRSGREGQAAGEGAARTNTARTILQEGFEEQIDELAQLPVAVPGALVLRASTAL